MCIFKVGIASFRNRNRVQSPDIYFGEKARIDKKARWYRQISEGERSAPSCKLAHFVHDCHWSKEPIMLKSMSCAKSGSNFANLQEGVRSLPSEMWWYQNSKEGEPSCQCRPSGEAKKAKMSTLIDWCGEKPSFGFWNFRTLWSNTI